MTVTHLTLPELAPLLMRCCEYPAIYAAMLAGRRGAKTKVGSFYAKLVEGPMAGSLAGLPVQSLRVFFPTNTRDQHFDDNGYVQDFYSTGTRGSNKSNIWKLRTIGGPGPEIDLVVSPVDGKAAAEEGREGGSVSCIAAIEKGGFKLQRHDLEKFFVVSIGPKAIARIEAVNDAYTSITSGDRPSTPPSGPWLAQYIASKAAGWSPSGSNPLLVEAMRQSKQLVGRLAGCITKSGGVPCATYILEDKQIAWASVFGGVNKKGRNNKYAKNATSAVHDAFELRKRRLNGSSVAASLVAMDPSSPGAHVFASVVRLPQVYQIAVAAHALGAVFLALPLASPVGKDYSIDPSAKWLAASDFLDTSKKAVLVASGISDHSALRGTRFLGADEVQTHSLAIETGNRSVCYQSRRFLFPDSPVRIVGMDISSTGSRSNNNSVHFHYSAEQVKNALIQYLKNDQDGRAQRFINKEI